MAWATIQGFESIRSYHRLQPKAINVETVRLKAAMHQIHNDMDATYGKRRMLSELKDMGFTVDLERVE